MIHYDANFLPFGFQYYRAPTPMRKDWDDDLRRMAELGFNTIKIWVQWRPSEPLPDKYVFDDTDELMDLAQRYGLKVVINVIFDVAPDPCYHHDAAGFRKGTGGEGFGQDTG